MLIRKRSTLTGKRNTMDLPVTPDQLRAWKRDGSPCASRKSYPT